MSALVAHARTEFILTMRRGESVLVTFLIPLGILGFFARVESVNTDFDDPVDFLVPGVLAIAVMSAAMVSLGIATGFERRYGVLKRLGSTPLGRGRLIAAKTCTVLALEALQALAILGMGAALGFELTAGVLPAILIVLIGTIAFAGIGLLMAGTLRAEANLALANALFLVLLFLGDMAYPLERLPTVLESLGRSLPAAALADSLRSVLVADVAFAADSFAVLVIWAVVAPLLAIRFFRWEE